MKAVVLGAGSAGLSAAWHLPESFDILILEKESSVGGLLRTDEHAGFRFDHGPHLYFHQDPLFLSLFQDSLKNTGFERKSARAGQNSFGTLVDFPYALHLKGMPGEVVKDCVEDFRERHSVVSSQDSSYSPKNYEDYCRHYFGDGFTDHFMIPYARKIWTVPPSSLDTSWVGSRVVLPPLAQVLEGAKEKRVLSGNYIKEFLYPKAGGSREFSEGLAGLLRHRAQLRTNSEVYRIDLEKKLVWCQDGESFSFDRLISSLPLPLMKNLIHDLPSPVEKALDQLDWTSLLLLNYTFDGEPENPYQWIYFDGVDVPFHRVHYPSRVSPSMAPGGGQSAQAEIAFSRHRPLPDSAANLSQTVWHQMQGAGAVPRDAKLRSCHWRELPFAYVIMDHQRAEAVRVVREYLAKRGMITCGRFGEWDYLWTDKTLASGKKAAENL